MSSKTNDTYRELTKAELDTVTGGSSAVSNAIDGIGKAITAAASERVWRNAVGVGGLCLGTAVVVTTSLTSPDASRR
jgi:hypothetical protein